MVLIIFIVILALLLTLSRRKVGYFLLAVLAGIYINNLINGDIVDFLRKSNVNIPWTTLDGVVALCISLGLAFIILPKNGKQEKWIIGIILSIIVAVVSVLVLSPAISNIFVPDPLARTIQNSVKDAQKWVVLAGIIISILDILSFKLKKIEKKS